MPGRHTTAPRWKGRSGLRSLVAVAGGAAIAAGALGFSSATAGASSDPVKATFGVTGVATSGCPVSTGGTDVYVQPGQELDVKSSLAGIYVSGRGLLGDLGGKLASLDGVLVIDPGTRHATTFHVSTKTHKINGLATGNHHWKWTVTSATLLNLLGQGSTVPLHLTSGAAKAGGKLSWSGTIHVTSHRTKCGIAIQLPSVSASVSASGLPPIGVGVPGVKVTVPAASVPTAPTAGGGHSHANHSSAAAPQPNNAIPVPAEVVPTGAGRGPLGRGGSALGDSGSEGGAAAGGARAAAGAVPAAKNLVPHGRTGTHKAADPASRPASTGEVWIVLAIVAVIALAFVAATYARLYLLKRAR